ncbi:MAG: HAMP domain-containing protein [Rhodoplanes sp.]
MNFDITNLRLTHKIAILTLGVALFAAVAVGTMGDWMLRSLASDLQARLPSGVATLERLTSEGRPVIASRIVTPDGKEGILLLVQMPLELAPTPALLTSETSPASRIIVAAQSDENATPIGPMRRNLLLTCLAVLIIGTLLGFLAAQAFTAPLERVVGDLDRLAKGDTAVDLSESSRTDEIGEISRAAVVFRDSITELNEARRKSSMQGQTASGGIGAALREQWEATKRLFGGEWSSFANRFRSEAAEASDRSGSTASTAWTAWKDFLNRDWGRTRAA